MEKSCIKKNLIQLGCYHFFFFFWALASIAMTLLEGVCFSISSVEFNSWRWVECCMSLYYIRLRKFPELSQVLRSRLPCLSAASCFQSRVFVPPVLTSSSDLLSFLLLVTVIGLPWLVLLLRTLSSFSGLFSFSHYQQVPLYNFQIHRGLK